MERIPVESSQIKSVGFNEDTLMMDVEFNSGSVYRYFNIDKSVFEEFIAAESVGKYFGANIKIYPDKYPFEKIRSSDRDIAKAESEEVSDE